LQQLTDMRFSALLDQWLHRVALAAGVLILAIWAFVDSDPGERRRAQIRFLLDTQQIGELELTDRNALHALVEWLLPAAGFSEGDWVVNRPTTRDRLGIYTVPAELSTITRCGDDNAVYDADLNSIFISNTLVKGISYISDGAGKKYPVDWSSRKLYLSLVLLHELGHQKLHGKSGFLYDEKVNGTADSSARQKELEADAYAFSRIRLAYSRTPNPATPKTNNQRALEPLEELTPQESLLADLVSLVESALRSTIKNGAHSPYQFDPAHPNFARRLKGIVDTIDSSTLSDKISAHYWAARDILDRINSISDHIVGEVKFPFPVAGIYFSGDLLWGASPNGLWASTNTSAPTSTRKGAGYGKLVAMDTSAIPRIPVENAKSLEIWGIEADHPTFALDSNWNLHHLLNNHWETSELRSKDEKKTMVYRSVWPYTAEASSGALILSSDDHPLFGDTHLHLVRSDANITERSTREIGVDVQAKLGLAERPLIAVGSINEDTVCVAFFDRDTLRLLRLRGIAFLNHKLALTRTVDFGEKSPVSSMFDPEVSCDYHRNSAVVVGVDLSQPGIAVLEVSLGPPLSGWRLRGRLIRLGEASAHGAKELHNRSEPAWIHPNWSSQTLYVQIFSDSLYRMEADGTSSIMFYPGEGSIALNNRLLAIGPGSLNNMGNNVYLLKAIR